jgi:bacillithiol biosynthesis cysteine-adding enzyme BshC
MVSTERAPHLKVEYQIEHIANQIVYFCAMPESNPVTFSIDRKSVHYQETGYFGKAILDYLRDADQLKPFYGRRPEIESFETQLNEKSASYGFRDLLVSALKEQYAKAKLKSDGIEALADDKTFTVTTGHQVCFFTGPLYSFYKIISTINTCRQLKEAYPDYNFVPVFWMATEDHDFEEANHFFLPNGKVEWESGQGGAVGRMELTGMEEILELMKEKLGIGYRSGEILEIFKSAYFKHKNVADASRYLVHHFFGSYGVVSIDGDDPVLKGAMIPTFAKELVEKTSFKSVSQTNKELAKNYSLQVTPREINLFYLHDQLRERIVEEEGAYEVLNSTIKFSADELKEEMEKYPERFSPNVVLRPLYQEMILPNLAYIGGGGELNYWFQLKGVFDSFKVPMPILMLRNSVMVIDRASSHRMDRLGLTTEELFRNSSFELEQELVKEISEEELNLKEAREKLEALFLDMESKLRKVDKLLEKSVRSGYVRSERIVMNLEKKMLRAEKKKHNILTGRLQKVHGALFPRDGLQERNLNFSVLYEEFGADLVPMLIDNLDPFSGEFTVLRVK